MFISTSENQICFCKGLGILKKKIVCVCVCVCVHVEYFRDKGINFSGSTQFLGGFCGCKFKTVISEIWFFVQDLIDGHLTDTCNSVPLIVIF